MCSMSWWVTKLMSKVAVSTEYLLTSECMVKRECLTDEECIQCHHDQNKRRG